MKQIWRAVAYTPNGDRIGVMPTPTEYSFSVPLNDISGATFNYLDGAIGWDVLTQPVEIAMEYTADNGLTWIEFQNGRYMRLGRGNDQLNPNDPRQYTLPGYAWLLSKMRQMKITGLNADGKRMFNSANAGMIMKTLIDEAHARNVCTGLAYNFNSSADSSGSAWNKVLSIGYEPGLDLFTILNNLAQQGIVDWYFQGRTLRVYNADDALAADSGVVLQATADITGLPTQASYEDLVHDVLVVGDNGSKFGASSVGVPTPWGRWEGFVGQGGVSDQATLTLLGQAFLEDGNHEKRQYTAEINFPGSTYEAMVDYRQGSYVTIPTEEGKQSFRIRQLNFSRDGDGAQKLDLVINDRFLEKEIRNARRVNGITGGASLGGSGSPPTKDPAARQPKKPDGLVVDSVAVVAPNGTVGSWATMSYPAVEVDKDDVALEISGYRFQARQPVLNLFQENPSFETAYTGSTVGGAAVAVSNAWASDGVQSIAVTPNGVDNTSGALPVGAGTSGGAGMLKMGILPGKKYVLAVDIRLAAPQGGTLNANARKLLVGLRNTAGVNSYVYSAAAPNRAGVTTLKVPFQASVSGVAAQDVFVRLYNGSSRVQDVVWFDNLRIYNDTQSPWDAWVSWGSSSSLTHSYGPLAPGIDWQVQMAAISAAGVPGAWSDSVAFTTAADVEPPAVPSAPVLTTRLGTLTVRWDGKNADGLGMATDFARCLVHQLGVADPIGSIYSTRTPMVLSDVVIGDSYEFWFTALDNSGNESDPSAHSSVTVASIMDDPEAALDIQNGVTVASGGNFNTYSPSTPSTPGQKEGDKWFQLTSGITVGVWRWSGTAWVPETLANATIANLDAGKITTGTLAAARIASGSITADKIAAGAIDATKLTATAIDGKTITGASINGGTIATGDRTAYNAGVVGFWFQSDGYMNVRANSEQFFTINPKDTTKYIRLGTAGGPSVYYEQNSGSLQIQNATLNSGTSGARYQIDSNGRFRVWSAASGNPVVVDINPTPTSQNMRVGGALFADQIAVGNAMAGTQYGGVVSDSSNGVQLTTTGNRHIYMQSGGSGQVRSPTIVDDFLTASDTGTMAARTGTGQLGMIGSARRFKANIQDHEFSGDILSVQPRLWYDRRDLDKYTEMLDAIASGVDPTEQELIEIEPLKPCYGLIAEEVLDAGLGEFVGRDKDGQIVTIAYERLWIALLPVVQKLRNRVAALEARLEV